jgi:AbrB family looped-hinge helix DNA binding protein
VVTGRRVIRMKALGNVRQLDELGRITIPKEIRDFHGWKKGQILEVFYDDDSIVLKAYETPDEKKEVLNWLENELFKYRRMSEAPIIKNAISFVKRA